MKSDLVHLAVDLCSTVNFIRLSLNFDLVSPSIALIDLECLIKKLAANLSITTVKNDFYLLIVVIFKVILGVDLELF